MENPYEKLLRMLPEIDPTERLSLAVMHKIERRETARARRTAFGFGLLALAALAAAVPIVSSLSSAFAMSGFGQYVTVFVTGGAAAMAHWQELLLSIVEALPVGTLTATVALALLCLISLRRFSTSVAEVRMHERFTGARLFS